ncbi:MULTISPECIES: DUF3769 domain-containing protein [unclassified Prochlorococcus]|uniref:DUF3769 domain-containing protein n=1 Tax=unclassified Prochlorococcus TaxID=2627481 RepID=UPI0005338176|nr:MULTISPECIES: DUF3769 domain-containing protein [unclassified Prochlorococcus]KGG16675.1 Repeats containing protein [Prochlorococcus sp. MIT 0602]KGG18353.1 Repeats containing protein [Prochlorococcus sp. MIT 0603]
MAAIVSIGWLASSASVAFLLLSPSEACLAFSKSLGEIAQNNQDVKLEKDDIFLELQILADSQYWEKENLFVAEGNVKALIHGGNIKADRIEVDRLNKTIIATGNVVFNTKGNYLEASSFKYDLVQNKGEVYDVYGVIDIKLIPKDLNLNKPISLKQSKDRENNQTDFGDVRLVDGFLIQGGFRLDMETIENFDEESNSVNKWRIKASKLLIYKDGWKAEKVSFTNDPFNPAQIRIESYKVELKKNNLGLKNANITAQKSYLLLEDFLRIPIGNRRFQIGKEEKPQNWILGVDGKDRDGVFIGRQLRSVQIGDKYSLSLQPQYLLQRSISGETSAYPENGKTFNSSKVTTSTNLEDLFGLEAEIDGSFLNWNSKIEADITTFNRKKFANGARYAANFSKEINLNEIKDLRANIFALYREKVWNGSLGNTDIYTAFGIDFDKNGSSKFGKIKYDYNFRIGLGEYQAERLDSLELMSSLRTNFSSEFKFNYPIFTSLNNLPAKYIASPFSAENIQTGINLNAIMNTSISSYNNNKYQTSITFGLGPELILGNLRRKYFDYTKLSILPSYTFKSGDSPFKFDNDRDLVKLKIDLTQQLLGPIIIKNINEYNIDTNSANYGDSISSKLAIMWQRRAYEFGLFYDYKNESGGLSFRLNGFDFKGNPSSF